MNATLILRLQVTLQELKKMYESTIKNNVPTQHQQGVLIDISYLSKLLESMQVMGRFFK